MSSRWALVAAFPIAAGVAAILAAGLSAPRAGVRVEPRVFDFGEADVKADIECHFRITNTGTDVLELADIKTHCACSDARLDNRRLLEEEAATLTVTFRTPDYSGPVRGRIIVKTSDRNVPIVPLRIVGSVRPTLQVVPSVLYFCFIGNPSWRDASARHAVLYAWGERDVTVQEVRSSAAWVVASFEREPRGHPGPGRVRVCLSDLPPRDHDRAEVTITARAGNETIRRTLTVLVDPP